jgi:hypothetical protein
MPPLAFEAPRSPAPRARASGPRSRPPAERGMSNGRAAALALVAALAGSGATVAALRALSLISR